jgi:hypothetical protein
MPSTEESISIVAWVEWLQAKFLLRPLFLKSSLTREGLHEESMLSTKDSISIVAWMDW